MDLELKPFKNPNNAEIFNAIRNNASYDYQRRIPAADKADQANTIDNLLNYSPGMNEFLFQLVNVIGLQIYRVNDQFTNPLAKFKREPLKMGDTIEEIMSGLLEAHRYNPNAEYLEGDIFGTERPNIQVNFHKINRKDWYKLTINEVELRKAFQSEYGLSSFISGIMSAPQASDQLDEFLLTAGLLKTWHNAGGYFNVNIPDISNLDSDSADSKFALRRLREMGDTLPFPSTLYNPAHMPMSVRPEDLELIITPQANAAMDVEALAGMFHIEKGSFNSRKTIIPPQYIGIPGFQAMLTTKDFFVLADSYYDVKSQQNPVGLTTNYFLHHHEVISASRFAPAILYTSTEESTPIIIQETPVTSVTAPIAKDAGNATVTSLIRGDSYQIISEAVTTPVDGENNAVKFVLVGAQSPRTKIWQTGFLTVAIDEAATSLTVNTVAVDDDDVTSTATFDVDGDLARLWPDAAVLEDDDDDNLFEVTPKNLTVKDGNKVTIPKVEGVQYKREGTDVPDGVQTINASTIFTAVAKTGFEIKSGATATWTLVNS